MYTYLLLLCICLSFHVESFAMEEELVRSLTKLNQALTNLGLLLIVSEEPTPQPTPIEKPHPKNFKFVNSAANIFQRQVLQQVNNANCGYYALKDTLYSLQAFEGSKQEREQLPFILNAKQIYNEDYKTWSKAIAERRQPEHQAHIAKLEQALDKAVAERRSKDAQKINDLLTRLEEQGPVVDWLTGAEIEWLYENKTPNKPKTPIWTIDNIDWISADFGYQGLATNPEGLVILENFRTHDNYMYGFLLNYAQEYLKEGTTAGGSGHWIGVVVIKQQGTYTYFVTDSLNKNRTNTQLMLALKNFIEKGNLTIIKIALSGIQNSIDTINTVMPAALGGTVPGYSASQEQAVRTVLRNIESIIKTAKENNFFNTDEFASYKQLLMVNLQEINATGKVTWEYSSEIPLWLQQLGAE